jgi:hypothetical protein
MIRLEYIVGIYERAEMVAVVTNLFVWIIVVLNKYVWFMSYILMYNVVTIENIMSIQLFIFDVDASVFINDVDALIYYEPKRMFISLRF